MFDRYAPLDPSPEEFEKQVKIILDAIGVPLIDYHSAHRKKMVGSDGNYEIDIIVRFSALGAEYLTLIECKRHASKIEREDACRRYGPRCNQSELTRGSCLLLQAFNLELSNLRGHTASPL